MAEELIKIPEEKKKTVSELAEKFKKAHTVLVASIKGLPASQFQKIKKNLKNSVEIVIAKRSLIYRALDETGKGALISLKESIVSDFALFFSDMDAFELSGLLTDSLSPAKAKAGDIAPEDIVVEPGPTNLIPGPAISELGSVGLKVIVEGGKLAIKKGATIVKKGGEINSKAAGVMAKLGIEPMKVGFAPVAAYDSKTDKVYRDIKVDKDSALVELRSAVSKALGFAVGIGYLAKETVKWFIARAGMEAKALEKFGDGERKTEESNVKTTAGGKGGSDETGDETKNENKKEGVGEDSDEGGKKDE